MKAQTLTQPDFTCDQDDLKILFSHAQKTYCKTGFNSWVQDAQSAYTIYVAGRENPKTFSQWINGQIIALSY